MFAVYVRAVLPVCFLLYWWIAGMLLWSNCSFGEFDEYKVYTRQDAVSWTAQVAFVVTMITIGAWVWQWKRVQRDHGTPRQYWGTFWRTFLLLFGFAVAGFVWWYLPGGRVLGILFDPFAEALSTHFAELRILGFAFFVAPVLAFVSGLLFVPAHDAITRYEWNGLPPKTEV